MLSWGWVALACSAGRGNRCVVSCAVRTRCVTARGSVGVRQWLFCEIGRNLVDGNIGQRPRARRQPSRPRSGVQIVLSTRAERGF